MYTHKVSVFLNRLGAMFLFIVVGVLYAEELKTCDPSRGASTNQLIQLDFNEIERLLIDEEIRKYQHLMAEDRKGPGPSVADLREYRFPSETNSSLDSVIVQVGDHVAIEALDELLSKLPSKVNLVIITPSLLFEVIKYRLNAESKKGRKIKVIRAQISSWSRDPYFVVTHANAKSATFIPVPDKISSRDVGIVSLMLPKNLPISLQASGYKGELDIEGGDIRADDRYVYVSFDSLNRSVHNRDSMRVRSEEDVVKELSKLVGKEVVVLGSEKMFPPDHHNDRYHCPLGITKSGQRTSLVGDISLSLDLLGKIGPTERDQYLAALTALVGEDRREVVAQMKIFFAQAKDGLFNVKNSREQQYLDETARSLQERGIRVVRVPYLPKEIFPSGTKNPMGMYYANAFFDVESREKGLQKVAYLPEYALPTLDQYAQKIYENEGFEPRTIRMLVGGLAEGGPRCLTQTIYFESQETNKTPPAR